MADYISLDFQDGLSPALAAMIKRAEDLSPAMQAIADHLEFSTRRRFETQIGPDGRTWTPSRRALGVANADGAPGKTLVGGSSTPGALLKSIDRAFGPDWSEVGTNVPYARPMQEGDNRPAQIRAHMRTIKQAFGKKLDQPRQVQVKAHVQKRSNPARPFIGLDGDDRAAIFEILGEHLGFAGKSKPFPVEGT